MEEVTVYGHEVKMDSQQLLIDDIDVTEILRTSAATYAGYAARHAEAIMEKKLAEEEARALEAAKFVEFREAGGTEKTSEMKARSCQEVVEARRRTVEAECNANKIGGWLQSLRERHDNCLNLGYNIRSEMKMIGQDTIRGEDGQQPTYRRTLSPPRRPNGQLAQFSRQPAAPAAGEVGEDG